MPKLFIMTQIIHNELKNYVRARGVLKVIMILQIRWKGDLMVLSFNLITSSGSIGIDKQHRYICW